MCFGNNEIKIKINLFLYRNNLDPCQGFETELFWVTKNDIKSLKITYRAILIYSD